MTEELNLTPTRPYMIRAFYHWLEDNNLTPYLVVDATHKDARVPTEHVQEGRIVLNIGSRASGNMDLGNDFISFSARFGGVSQEIWIPIQAVLAIFSKENPKNHMPFDPREYDNYTPSTESETQNKVAESTNKKDAPRPKRENKAGLRILK